mgnify:FL=1
MAIFTQFGDFKMEEYYIGQKFGYLKREEIAEIAKFCNTNGTCHLFCIDENNYEIRKNPESDKKDILRVEKQDLEQWLRKHDYIGTKIATGRATVEEYADEIAEMTAKANRINEIDEELKTLEE